MLPHHLEALNLKADVLGNSALPLTDTMITPFTRPAVIGNHERSLFNITRHSGARVECTEDTFDILKRRFPVLWDMMCQIPWTLSRCVVFSITCQFTWVMLRPWDMFDDQENGRPDQILNNDNVIDNK